MSAKPDTRKPIDELTADDFDAFPMWEFATDEEDVPGVDETWVRPVLGEVVPGDAFSLSVAADFVGPTGREFEGFVVLLTGISVSEPDGAILLYRGRYLPVAYGSEGVRRRFSQTIEIDEREIFPLKYVVRLKVEGESDYREGELQ